MGKKKEISMEEILGKAAFLGIKNIESLKRLSSDGKVKRQHTKILSAVSRLRAGNFHPKGTRAYWDRSYKLKKDRRYLERYNIRI